MLNVDSHFVSIYNSPYQLTVSKSKNSASFYVQKSIRKPDGSVTTITIEKLGNLDEVKTRAQGMDPYKWAQEYVNELNRREYEDQKAIIIPFSPSKLLKENEQRLCNCGYLFLQSVYYSLGLKEICTSITAFCAAQWPPVRLPVATRRWQWPGLISHFPFNHNDIVFRHPLEQRV